MKIRWNTMGNLPHSWAFVTQALAKAMLNIGGHEVFYKSTDGLNNLPDDLKHIFLPGYHGFFGENKDSQGILNEKLVDYITEDRQFIKVSSKNPLPEIPDKNIPYDMDLAYTIFYQAPRRFHPLSRLKALIWNFESSIIPYGWHLYHRAIDYILPSSQFSYDIFANCGVPKDKMLVVPHGVDLDYFNPEIPPFQLKTKKKVKFLHNAIPHARKCHDRVLKAYLDTFTANDDVCLVMKTKFLTPDPTRPFEVDVKKIIEDALKGRKNPAEIEVVTEFVPHIGSLYTSTDAVVSMSSTEGFCLLPGTKIDTQRGLVYIEEMEKNDVVISHTRKQNKVTGTTKRNYCGEIISFKRVGCSEWFSGTPEHPHLVIKSNNRSFSKLKKDVLNGEQPSWCNLSKLEKGDLVCIPKPKNYSNERVCLKDYFHDIDHNHIFLELQSSEILESKEFFFTYITEVEKRQYSGYVYNLHVENDESYTSFGMATHNCLPLLEALACDSLVIAPRHGGQLDFLNDKNSLLVDTGEMYAPPEMQYWHYDPKAVVGDPDVNHFSQLLRQVYENPNIEKERIKKEAAQTSKKFSWENAAQMILDLPIPSTNRINYPKKKVLYIVPYAIAGGGEVWVREMIKKLDRNIYEPHVAFVWGVTESLKSLFEDLDVVIEDLGTTGKGQALKCLIESENYSIVHFYNSFGVYRILKECWRQGVRKKMVETVHSDLVWNDSMTRVARREECICSIATVSNNMTKKMIKYGNKNVTTIPHVIDWERFEKTERSKDILKEFGVPDGFVVGFVGRLSPEKNINCVLKCAEKIPDASFVIVGGGPQENILKQLSKNLKNVFFVGERRDVEKFYASFDVLLLPSLMEGLPFVVLEAMTLGTPVVASDVGGVSELVKNNENGFLVSNPNDHLLFIDAINKLKYNDKWKCFSENSLKEANNYKNMSEEININSFYNKLF